MLASRAAERLQAEAHLRAEKGSLVGEVNMLTQTKKDLSAHIAQLTADLQFAENLAESRLIKCQEAVQQVWVFFVWSH